MAVRFVRFPHRRFVVDEVLLALHGTEVLVVIRDVPFGNIFDTALVAGELKHRFPLPLFRHALPILRTGPAILFLGK